MPADRTEILSLPFLVPSQAQKYITHNEALEKLDALVQLAIAGTAAAPAEAPQPGERWLVAPEASGAFAGHAGEIAAFQAGAWVFFAPAPGWLAYDGATGRLLAFDGAEWGDPKPPAALADLDSIGINATADAQNRLAVASPASLFNHEGSDHRLKINKAATADTASLLYQTAYSGRAEMGLAGNDDLAVKVSADGANWREALRVDGASGHVSFPSGGVREMLFAARTYYVDPAGDDANSGLTAAAPFLTLQKAVDAALALDANGNAVAIQLAGGTHAGAVMGRPMFDGGTLSIQGNGATPANVTIDGGAGPALRADAVGAKLSLRDLRLTGQIGLWARYGAVIFVRGTTVFGPATARQVSADNGGYVEIIATVEIAGGAQEHFYSTQNGHILMTGSTVTLTGAPAFSDAFAVAQYTGLVSAYGNSYSGNATGPRYRVSGNGVIFVNATGNAVFPGDTQGVITSGGQYT